MYQRVRQMPIENRNLIGNFFVFKDDQNYNETPDAFFDNTRRDNYCIVKIIEKDNIKQTLVEIIEDNHNDPDSVLTPQETLCAIWEKKN